MCIIDLVHRERHLPVVLGTESQVITSGLPGSVFGSGGSLAYPLEAAVLSLLSHLPVYSKQGRSVRLMCGNCASQGNTVLVEMLKPPSHSPRHCHRRLCCPVNTGRSAECLLAHTQNQGHPYFFLSPTLADAEALPFPKPLPTPAPGQTPVPGSHQVRVSNPLGNHSTLWAASPARNKHFPLFYFHHLSGDF